MPTITLIASSHRESGRCNAGELLRILQAISPDIIFTEQRAEDFTSYYRNGVVEAHAIAQYRSHKKFQHVPVDQFETPDLRARNEMSEVFNFVEQSREEYQYLRDQEDRTVPLLGFDYLNSAAYEASNARLVELEDETIRQAGDSRLNRRLQWWRNLMRARERSMVSGIYEFCAITAFETGVFIVGAAHRADIIRQITEISAASTDVLIRWNMNYGCARS